MFLAGLFAAQSARLYSEPARISYDETNATVTVTDGLCRLDEIADSLGSTGVFFYNPNDKEALCAANLIVGEGAKLVIGAADGETCPWDSDWQPRQTLKFGNREGKRPYRIEVTPEGDIEVLFGRIAGANPSTPFNSEINGVVRLEQSLIEHGSLMVNRKAGSRGMTRGIVKGCLFRGAGSGLTIRSGSVRAENCRFEESGRGLHLWNASGPIAHCTGPVSISGGKMTLKDCRGKRLSIGTFSRASLSDCRYDQIVYEHRQSMVEYVDKFQWLRLFMVTAERKLAVQVKDEQGRPVREAVVKAIGYAGKEEYESTARTTDEKGQCDLVIRDYQCSEPRGAQEGGPAQKHEFTSFVFVDMDGDGPQPFLRARGELPVAGEEVITIWKDAEGWRVE